MALIAAFLEIFHKPTIGDMMLELVVFMVPIWIAVVVGVLVGWAWKPKWANLKGGEPNNSGIVPQFYAYMPSFTSLKLQLPNPTAIPWISDLGLEKSESSLPSVPAPDFSSTKLETNKSSIVNEDDLRHLYRLVEEKDGGPSWIKMMDKSTPNMSYQAWRRDAETGPPQYRSRTIYEDATPEALRDFFWDDDFRLKWDDMLGHAETLEEWPESGTMMVKWVRKFPFFCSDREYIIGRRIWDCGRTYYCVTKGVPNSVPRHDKPRRVDLYYSSWFIRTAESRRDGRMTACEVILFHHEDMGIPREIAKLGIRQGMWGAVKKIDPGLRAYQKHQASGAQLSRPAAMAQINTKVSPDYLESDETSSSSTSQALTLTPYENKSGGKGMPKMLIFAGVVALACTLDRGLLTKAVVFGVARRFANTGRRL